MATLGNLVVQIGAATKDLDDGLSKAAKTLEKFGKKLQRDGQAIARVVTLPLAGFAAAALASSEKATKAFKEFGERTKATFGKFGDEIAKAVNLEGVLAGVSSSFEKIFNWFDHLDESTKAIVVSIGAMAAAVGPLIILLGSLAASISAIVVLLTGPAGWVVAIGAAVVAAVGLGVSASGAFDSMSEEAKKFNEHLDKTRERLTFLHRLGAQVRAGSMTEQDARDRAAGHGPLVPDTGGPAIELDADEIKDLRTRFPDMAKQIDQAMEANKVAEERNRIMATLDERLKRASAMEHLLGDDFDENAVRLNAYSDAFVDLSATGLAETDMRLMSIRSRVEELNDPIQQFLEKLRATALQVSDVIRATFDSLTQGIGDAIARVIVYGENAKEVFTGLFKQILASLVSMVAQMILQWIILSIFGSAFAKKSFSSSLGRAAGSAAAFAYAASVESLGLAGLVAGAGFAATAASGATLAGIAGYGVGAGAALGAAAATGGMFETPTITSIAERGPEIVLNKRNVEDFFGSAMPGSGGRSQQIGVYLDGKTILNYVVRGMPDMLRLHGAA